MKTFAYWNKEDVRTMQVSLQPKVSMLRLSWPHLKPEFSWKLNEDAETCLLRISLYMDIQAFPEGVKVQRFCLTLLGEAKLWYESLRPIAVDWNGLQAQLKQQYSNIANTRAQLFPAWRPFYFDENSETIDNYATQLTY